MVVTVCVYKQVDFVTAGGYLCAGWARANRNQEESTIKSYTHPAQALFSVVISHDTLMEVLIFPFYWSDADEDYILLHLQP